MTRPTRNRLRRLFAVCVAAGASAFVTMGVTGCMPFGKTNPAETVPVESTNTEGSEPIFVQPSGDEVATSKPQDPVRTGMQYFQLEMYELVVPIGTISRNSDFWKPFDETFLGIWKHDVLYKNGLRVGRAPISELNYLTDQLKDAESNESSIVGIRGKDFEIPLRKNVDRQSIFWFDKDGRMSANDYTLADNFFALTFRQTPRTSDHVRIALAPAIREVNERIEFTNAPGESPRFVKPQTFFAVGIETDLGAGECLVVSSSNIAEDVSLTIGRAFMTEDRLAQRVEKVIVIIPRLRGELREITNQPPAR